MKAPTLLFQPRAGAAWLGHASSRAQRAAALLCALGCLLLVLAAGWRAWWLDKDVEAAQQAAQRTALAGRTARPAPAPVPAGPPISPQRLRAINAVVDRLNLPWPALLDLLELETRPPVTLLTLVADAERGSLRLEAQAPALADLLAYAQRLRQQPAFAQVLLLRHEADERERLRPMRLSLDLLLAPGADQPVGAAAPSTERR